MVDSSLSRIIASRSLVRVLTKRRFTSLLALSIVSSLSLPVLTAQAHQPVRLTTVAKKIDSSPILIDGTVSFAVYADFTKAATRHVRFRHVVGDQLAVQYLIPDTASMRGMKKSRLPIVTITSPSGKVSRLVINERTRFSKPYLPQDYFYLSRISAVAEAGTYKISVKAKSAASALVAIGTKEIPGEVLEFGSTSRLCPVPIEESEAIKQSVAEQLIGMKEESAQLCAESNGWGYRVGERDGELFALTMDYRFDRITVSITKAIITAVAVG
jgi:hypothetical protein